MLYIALGAVCSLSPYLIDALRRAERAASVQLTKRNIASWLAYWYWKFAVLALHRQRSISVDSLPSMFATVMVKCHGRLLHPRCNDHIPSPT